MTNIELHRLSTKLFEAFGKVAPNDPNTHIFNVSVALLNHVQRDRDAASFEAAVTTMHAVLGRRLFAHEWRHAWLFRDIQIVDAPN